MEMENLFVQETWIEVRNKNTDKERRIGLGESDVYETFTDDRGELYRAMQKEYGRCISKIYVDEAGFKRRKKMPKFKEIGWVFVKREKYGDCNETYLQETWVTVQTKEPARKIEASQPDVGAFRTYHYFGEVSPKA